MLAGIPDQAELIVFVLILANQAGVPVVAAPALLGVGALAANGDVRVGVAATGAVCAALCADLAWYGLGRWRGSWALAALRRLLGRTGPFLDEAQRLFLAHDRAFQLGARFLPELNPLAAALAGEARVSLKRFAAGAIASAALWVGTWIGAGYAIGNAWNGGSEIALFGSIVAGSAVVSLSLTIRPVRRAIATIARALRRRTTSRPDGRSFMVTSWERERGDARDHADPPGGMSATDLDGGPRHQKGDAVMDMNEYVLEVVARDRLAEMREAAARSHRVRAARRASRPMRIALGHGLIRIGRRLQGVRDYSVTTIDVGGAGAMRRRSTHEAVRG
jgi:membrane protein DedA with SNARE-associated domain